MKRLQLSMRGVVFSWLLITFNAFATTHFVDLNCTNPVSPYIGWSTAATNIQDAIDAATNGDLVLVTNGIYKMGGRAAYGTETNRVMMTNFITLLSINGPTNTFIVGGANTRCAYVGSHSILDGFTLTNGHAPSASGPLIDVGSGGGAWCESGGVISNCFVVSNFALAFGAGVFGGTVYDSIIASNILTYNPGGGGGACSNVLINCILKDNNALSVGSRFGGGGALGSSLTNCQIVGNQSWLGGGTASSKLAGCVVSNNIANGSSGDGGGMFMGFAVNSLISSNLAANGGGVYAATLDGCILFSNIAEGSGDIGSGGGGAYNSAMTNCILYGNSAPNSYYGGGSSAGTLVACTLAKNSANYGGGAYGAKLIACMIVSNNATAFGGGVNSCILTNCLLVENSTRNGGGGAYSSLLVNCTVATNSAHYAGGTCLGTNYNSIVFYNSGDAPNYVVSVMAFCDTTPAISGSGNITNAPAFVNLADGDFQLQSNSPCINTGNNNYVTSNTDLDGDPRIVNGVVDMGAYEYQGNIRYVSLTSTNPVPPYSDWSIAATNIQDAIDVASPGDEVLVTNGIYATGGSPVNGNALTNRVVIDKAMMVRSVNGPETTEIRGNQMPGTTNGDSAIRCVYITNGASLSGFTLAGGATRAISNGSPDGFAGGIWCESVDVFITNCVIVGNASGYAGGGVYSGTLTMCIISTNRVLGGRGWGGGVFGSTLNNCILNNNSGFEGGGAYSSTLTNCLLFANTAGSGGGTESSTLTSCTVVNNSAGYSGGGIGGGSADAFAYNCIVYYNSAPHGSNWYVGNISYGCTYPMPSGTGNITNAPLFLNTSGGDFRLQSNSPCINSGNNTFVTITNDLDGNPRIVDGTVDVGAYEYQTPSSVLSYAWAQRYGLPTDGTADNTDTDGDGMNNFGEWKSGTNPTNALSLLQLESPVFTNALNGVVITWQSVTNVTYYLQRSSDLSAGFSSIHSNLVGQAGHTSYTDTLATNAGPYFYRVGVQ